MKTTYKYFLGALAIAASMAACSPDEFEGVNEAGIPEANSYASLVKIEVDQEINQISLKLDAPAVYPIWTITKPDGKEVKSTVNGFSQIFTVAGEYLVSLKVGNHNGISDGTYTTTFYLENSLIDMTPFFTKISKAPWHIANKEKGHMACGPDANDPTSWWAAGEDDKKDWGVYDNVLTFTDSKAYTFDPGDHQSIYVNKDVTVWPDYRNPDADFNVPVTEIQNSTFDFEIRGEDVYLTFPKGTYFPYIANNEIWEKPEYRVMNITPKKMTLVIAKEGIAWQYILTTEDTVERVFAGFTYNQPDNIWKNIEVKAGGIYYADAGWSPYPDNGGSTFEVTNQETKVVLPMATASQWQAQFPIHTNIGPGSAMMTSAKHYDFSCVINSNKDLKGMTLKLVETGDNGVPGSLGIAYDANAVFYDNSTNLTAYEDYVFYLVDQPGVDIQDNLLQLVLDFGGCAEGTEVTIKNIVLIEHDKNTELDKLPGDDPGDVPAGGVIWAGVDDPANLMTQGQLTLASTWFANDSWSELANQPTVEINGRNAKITVLEACGGSQWQGQVHLNTQVGIEEGKAYDFSITINASQDLSGATVKPHPEGDDAHFFSEGRHDIAGYEDVVITYENFVADFSTGNLVITLDFPGSAAGTTIEVKNIIIQEHNEAAGGGGESWVDVNSADNLMNSGALALASTWFANDGWSELANQPTVEITGNNALITVNEACGGSQWQGQVHFNTGVAIEEGKTYDFSIVLTPSQDLAGATVKPHPEGDDAHFFSEGRHDLAAYEDNRVKYMQFTADFSTSNLVITLDFPGCAAGTQIEVKNIIIQEHRGAAPAGTSWVDANSAENLLNGGTLALASTWFANDGWSELANQPTVAINGRDAKITVNEACGGSQWQGQVHFNTGVAIEEGTTYDFAIIMTPSQDLAGATVKPHPEGDDAHFFSEGRHDLASYEDNRVTYEKFTADFSTSNLVITLDFPGCAAGTEIDVTGIIIQKHK